MLCNSNIPFSFLTDDTDNSLVFLKDSQLGSDSTRSLPDMDNLSNLITEISRQYPDGVPMALLESYCRRYLHYYHRHIQPQPVRFYGAWGWSEARRREFRRAFDASGIVALR